MIYGVRPEDVESLLREVRDDSSDSAALRDEYDNTSQFYHMLSLAEELGFLDRAYDLELNVTDCGRQALEDQDKAQAYREGISDYAVYSELLLILEEKEMIGEQLTTSDVAEFILNLTGAELGGRRPNQAAATFFRVLVAAELGQIEQQPGKAMQFHWGNNETRGIGSFLDTLRSRYPEFDPSTILNTGDESTLSWEYDEEAQEVHVTIPTDNRSTDAVLELLERLKDRF